MMVVVMGLIFLLLSRIRILSEAGGEDMHVLKSR